jgi:NitT/TauT family transport system substrate-binding protein
VPFNVSVRAQVPGAIKLTDAAAYYPQSAVLGGWVARNEYYQSNRDALAGVIRGWADANDYMVRKAPTPAQTPQKKQQPDAPFSDIAESFRAQKMFTAREWKRLYADGTVVKWLQQVSDFFMADGRNSDATPASEYFDPALYLSTI